MTSLEILTQLSLLLLIGMVATGIARKVRMSNVLLLLLLGLLIGRVTSFFDIPSELAEGLAIITLAIVIFEGTSRISYRQLSVFSGPALEVTGWQVFLATVLLGGASYWMFFSQEPYGVLLAAILAVTLAGTDPSSVMIMLKDTPGKITSFLRLEAVLNTPLIVLIPFIILDAINTAFTVSQLVGILQQVVVGIGAGVILGLVIFRMLRKFYAQDISTVAVIAMALIAYIVAENLQGSGVLAVATLGIMFGNFHIKKKEILQDFSYAFYNILELIIFLLIGIGVGIMMPLTPKFLLQSFVLFLLLFVARLISIIFVFRDDLSWKERIFVSVTMPKGIAVSVLIFTFALESSIPQTLLSILFAITIYSILTATFSSWWWSHIHKRSVVEDNGKKPTKKASAH